jgi:hypothetical protein
MWFYVHIDSFCSGITQTAEEYTTTMNSISNMYFSLWTTPGVSERMWSVNLEVPISEDYQTTQGHSGRRLE